MSDSQTAGPDHESSGPERDGPWRWVLAGVEIAVGLALTIAWVGFLVWVVAQLV